MSEFNFCQVLASGDASKFDLAQLKKLGCAVTGLDATDLAKLKLNIDIIAELGKHSGWSTQQVNEYSFHLCVNKLIHEISIHLVKKQ